MNQAIVKNEEYQDLIDECKNLLSETRFSLALMDIEWRHKLGETIAKSSFIKKYKTGRGEFIEGVAKDIGLSKSLVYYCIEFYEKYNQLSTLMENLNPEKKALKWSSDILPLLSGGDKNKAECRHKDQELEVLTIERVRGVS